MADPLTIGTSTMGAMHVIDQVANRLRSAKDVYDKANTITNGGNLIAVSASTRIEPFMLVDYSLINLEWLDVIANSMLSRFSAFWLLAVDSMARVSDVTVGDKLAPLNPNRGIGIESYKFSVPSKPYMLHKESYKYGLPITATFKPSMEAGANKAEASKVVGDQAIDMLNEKTDLSVGKMFNITLTENKNSANVKVAIRLQTAMVPTNLLKDILSTGSYFDMEMKERWHAFLAGRITFWRDLVMCKDIMDKRKKIAVKDKSGIYQAILKRNTSNMMAGLLSKVPSLATLTNILVIDHTTLDEIEPDLGGPISRITIRNQLFESTSLMMICVVERDMDRCVTYYRDISTSSISSIKDMKASNKSGGSEVADLFKAFIQGNAPVI